MVASSLTLVLGAFTPVHSQELFLDKTTGSPEGWYKSYRSYNGDTATGYDEKTTSWNGDDYEGRCDCGDAGHVCGKGSSQGKCSSVSDCEDICDAVGDCQGFYLFPPGSGLNTADGGGCYFKKFTRKVSAEEELTLDNTVSAEATGTCTYYDIRTATSGNDSPVWIPYPNHGGHVLDDYKGRCDCGPKGSCESGGASCSHGSEGVYLDNCKNICNNFGTSDPNYGCIGFALCDDGCYFKTPSLIHPDTAEELKVSAEEELTLDNTASAEVMGTCTPYDKGGNQWGYLARPTHDLDEYKGRCDCGPNHVCEDSHNHMCSGDNLNSINVRNCADICQGLGDSCIGFYLCADDGCYFKTPELL